MLELNSSFLWIFFLLWILYFTLNRFFFKPIGRIISEREARAAADEARRREMMAEIEARTRSLEERLGLARKQAQRIREEWLRNGEETRSQTVAEARERSTKVMDEKMAQLESEMRAAERSLEAQISLFSEKIRQAYL